MVIASKQGKREFCIALYNRKLNAQGICPANHEVGYFNGWFNFDGEQFRDPDLTAEADKIIAAGTHRVLYWEEGNTYVLDSIPQVVEHDLDWDDEDCSDDRNT